MGENKHEFYSIFRRLKRKPQVILPEVGMFIMSKILPDSDWVCLDAGGGSGFMSILMAHFIPDGRVITYEKNPSHAEAIKKNIEISGIENITLFEKELPEDGEGIPEINWANLDLKNPEKYLEMLKSKLGQKGVISVYSPQIEQVIAVSERADNLGMKRSTYEINWREWKVDTRGYTHPSYTAPPHTGFVTIIRKVNK